MDELASQRQDKYDQWDQAQVAGQYQDYSRLNDLGVDTGRLESETARQTAWQEALQKAEYGDYSGLNALGVDTSNNSADWQRRLQEAELAAQYGDYSRLREMGIDTSGYEARLAAQTSGTGSGTGSGTVSGGESGSLMPLLEDAKSKAEVFDAIYGATGDRLLAEQYAENWEAGNKQTDNTQPYKSVYDTMNEMGLETYEDAMAYLMSTGYSTADAMEIANNYLSVRESGRYNSAVSGGTGNGTGSRTGSGYVRKDDSYREQFLESFTQAANGGASLDELGDRLDIAVENGWITQDEAKRLKINAQANHYLFFANK